MKNKHPLRLLRIIIASFIGCIVLCYTLLLLPWVQQQIGSRIISSISKKIGAEVRISSIQFNLFNRLDILNLLVKDKKNDTLFYTEKMKLRVSDLFFSPKDPTIRYIGLENTKIFIQRKQPIWNYQFIIDVFSKKDTVKKSELEFDLKKIELAGIQFIQNDQWIGEEMRFIAKHLNINLKKFENKNIEIEKVILDKPFYTIQSKKGNIDLLKEKKQISKQEKNDKFNSSALRLNIQEIQIAKGKFWIEYGYNSPVPYFDGEHIRMEELNATITNLNLLEDTLKANVHLSLKERSGLVIQKLKTNFRMTPQIMELAKLYLKTNKSVLGPYYAMEYTHFLNDFRNYISKVKMRARFVNASIASDDIAYFAPALKNINQVVRSSFNFYGSVDDFEASSLTAQYGSSFINGRFSMKGIPEMRKTQINFSKINAKTNLKDLAEWIPDIIKVKEINLAALGALYYKGDFSGTPYDFYIQGNISSELGVANTDLKVKLPKGKEPIYEGNLKTSQFNAGKLFNLSTLGLITFKGGIAGTSFNLNNIKTKVEGVFDTITFNNYTYTNIEANGILQKKAFSGNLNIKDKNIHFLSNIEVNFQNKIPNFNALGDLTFANLGAIQLSKTPIELTGLIDVNFSGNTIDNFIGFAKFYNGKLKGENESVQFDSLAIESAIDKGLKKITIASDALNASLTGKFTILNLPNSIQYFAKNYFPNYIDAPKEIPENQVFEFAIKTSYFEPYLRIFEKAFSGFNNLTLTGAIDTEKKFLRLNSEIPYAQWKAYAVTGGNLMGQGSIDSLSMRLTANQFNLTDSFNLVSPIVKINTSKDQSAFELVSESKSALAYIATKGSINTYTDGFSIKWAPSYFILNQKKWDIENGGELSIRKNNTYAKNLRLSQGLQFIDFKSNPENKNGLIITLENLILGDITKTLFSYPSLEGITKGRIVLNDLLSDFSIQSALTIDQFNFNNEPIGLTELGVDYQSKTGLVPFKFNSLGELYDLNAEGTYHLKDSANPLDATLYLNNTHFGLVQQFIGDVLTNLEGKAKGMIHFGGRIENPYLLGSVSVEKASFVVDYTKVKYGIDKAVIDFTNEGIDFGTIEVKDKLNRAATFKGKIIHQGFKHLVYDMEMNSPKIELVNMKSIDNSNFYGNAVGKAFMSIKGPEENIKMAITAEINDSSQIYLPNSTSKETSKSEFISFKKIGRSAEEIVEKPTYNLVVDLDVSADNKTKIDVILDELTGDVIRAVGNGRIKLRAGNIEPLTIRGKYNIEGGKYDFNFQSFIKKPFELIPGAGNYIEWTGNPYEADIRIDARYTAERVSLNELLGAGNFSNAVRSYRGGVYVIAALRNKLSKPDIQFSLAFPQGSPISTDNEFAQLITRLERDENEILKQVSFLIVFNSFAPLGFNSGNTNNAYTVTTIGINTISQLLTKEINKSLTGLINKITGDNSLRFDVGSSVYNSGNLLDPSGSVAINSNKIDRQRVNIKLGRSFLGDKVIVNFGGDFDFNVSGVSNIQNGNFQWLPDLNIEFILTRDRKLRAILFNRNSLDVSGSSLGRRNRQGLSISYRKDFEKFIF